MKNTLRSLVLSVACAGLLLPATLSAQTEQGHMYIGGDVGGNITQNADLEEYFGTQTAGSKVEFDPGFRFGVHFGYNVTDWFAPEAELGVMQNWIHSITGAERLDASFANVPFLVNAKFQLPNNSRFTPFIGVGAGVSAAILDADIISINGVASEGASSDAVFAYQGFAGVRYKLNDNLGLSVEYRYFATESPEWEADFTVNTFNDVVRFGRIQTHAVSLAVDYSF